MHVILDANMIKISRHYQWNEETAVLMLRRRHLAVSCWTNRYLSTAFRQYEHHIDSKGFRRQ